MSKMLDPLEVVAERDVETIIQRLRLSPYRCARGRRNVDVVADDAVLESVERRQEFARR
jgi:hypothetical protein